MRNTIQVLNCYTARSDRHGSKIAYSPFVRYNGHLLARLTRLRHRGRAQGEKVLEGGVGRLRAEQLAEPERVL